MKKNIFLLVFSLLAGVSTFSQSTSKNKMNTIVLVHGAWVDESCWDKVVPALKASGH